MKGDVNYYHYSVYKLLVVNLTTRFQKPYAAEKKTGFGHCAATLPNPASMRLVNLKKNFDSAHAAALDTERRRSRRRFCKPVLETGVGAWLPA